MRDAAREGRRPRPSRLAALLVALLGPVAALPLGGALACGDAPRPHLLLITVDTLRRDHLGAHGDERELTPHLDALARESLVFERAYAPAPFTLPSVTGLLTGRTPAALGMDSNHAALGPRVPTLATRLWDAGYRTGAVVSNAVLRTAAGLHHGFDDYDVDLQQQERVRRNPERTAPHTTEDALALLDRLRAKPEEKPIFLWVHYQDPHGPYTPPATYRSRYLGRAYRASDARRHLPQDDIHLGLGAIPRYQFLPGHHEPAWYRAGYAGEVRYTDEWIGRLLDGIAERGMAERTWIVFASDHGEGLGERDYWFAHGEFLTDWLVRVPLFLHLPEGPRGRRHDLASLLDVVPTLLPRLGAAVPERAAGRDLLADGAAEAEDVALELATLTGSTVERWGLVRGSWKYVVSGEGDEATAALHRVGADDEDLRSAHPEVARRLRAELAERRERVAAVPSAPAPALSREEREAFEALGYLRPEGEGEEAAPDRPAPGREAGS